MRSKGIIFSATILTVTSFITKVLGFVYRVYMSNKIGAEGMGLYQLIMPVYMLCWAISASGFTVTVSNLVARYRAKNEYANARRILNLCIITTFFISLLLSFIVFIFSKEIGFYILKDQRTILSLKVLSLCFVFMAVSSCIRGYFFAVNEAFVPATSQVFEQIIRMTVVFLFCNRFIPLGLEYACLITVIGMCAGEILSFFYVYFFYKYNIHKRKITKKANLSKINAYKQILFMAIPLTLNKITSSLLSSFENILIPLSLQKYGLSPSDAMATFGNLTGMAMPLIMFPSSFLTALCTCLIPVISSAVATKDKKRIEEIVSKAILFTFILGFFTGGIFMTFPYETGYLIYKSNMKTILFLLGMLSPFLYLQVVLNGILNGIGEQVFIFRNSLISSLITISFIYFLMPVYGIYAFISGWFISILFVGFLDIQRVIKRTKISINFVNSVIKPMLISIFCCLSGRIIYLNLKSNIGFIFCLIYISMLYIFLLIFFNCIKKNTIKKYIKSIL